MSGYYTSYATSLALREAGRLLRHVQFSPGDCWRWKGATDKDGYGVTTLGGKWARAHRAVYAVLTGRELARESPLDHLCRTPPCVNPLHLEEVSARENTVRGVGPTAKNAAKTACVCGSGYAIDRNGERYCRACKLRRQRERRRATWAAASAGDERAAREVGQKRESDRRAWARKVGK